MPDLTNLQSQIIAFRDARDWQQFHNPKDMAISLCLEAAELLEHFQWKNPEEIKAHLKANKTDVEDELIDVLYWVLLMAHDLDIDIEQAFANKLAKNEQKYPVEKAKSKHQKYDKL
jgi:NTP pyrophosphatase (non-canonical NTP hydrolase)